MSNQWPPPPHGGGPYGQQASGRAPQYSRQPGQGRHSYGQAPQYAPQPTYVQQPPLGGLGSLSQGGGGDSNNGKLLLALGGAGLVVIALVLTAIFVFGGGAAGAGSDPEQALDSFVTAIKGGDCDAIEDITTDAFQQTMNVDRCGSSDLSDVAGMERVELAVGDVEQDGDAATGTIDVTGVPGADDPGVEVTLVDDGDGWKVDAFDVGEAGTRQL